MVIVAGDFNYDSNIDMTKINYEHLLSPDVFFENIFYDTIQPDNKMFYTEDEIINTFRCALKPK